MFDIFVPVELESVIWDLNADLILVIRLDAGILVYYTLGN